MAAAIERMVNRMRQGVVVGLSVNWHASVVWQSPVPKVVYPGETIHLAAILGEKPAQVPSLNAATPHLVMVPSTAESPSQPTEIQLASTSSALTRIVGAMLMRDAADTEAASQIALKYQLVTEHTNLFMVVQREAENKALGLPEPHQVKQMVAAGWHGIGSVRQVDVSSSRLLYSMAHAAPLRSTSTSQFLACYDAPRFMRRQANPEIVGIEPIAILAILEDVAMNYTDFEDAMTRFLNCGLPQEVELMVDTIASQLGDKVLAWAVFLDWLIVALDQAKVAPRQVKRLLSHTLYGISADADNDIRKLLSNRLPEIAEESWGSLADDTDALDIEALIARQNI